MNITSYLQDRQHGLVSHRGRHFKYRKLDQFLDEKITESFVNKPCSVSGSCRSTFIMEFSPDGTKIASTHGDHTVRVTDISTGQCVRTLQGHPRTPWCLAYHPSSSHILASGCLGGEVRIWDLYGYGCEVWQTENSTVIASLTFHPTDHVLVIAAGNSLYFWDWSQPEPFTKCSTTHEYERIRWVRFNSLGQFLYTGISNNTAIHRDEVSRVSLSSQTQITSPRNPARMSNVYSRIINRYQEYRRDRLAQETTPQTDEQGSSTQPESGESDDLYPGVRDIDIVEPRSPSRTDQRPYNSTVQTPRNTTPDRVADQMTQLSNSFAESRRRSAASMISDCLINPRNDPFLSPGPSQSIFVNTAESGSNLPAPEALSIVSSSLSSSDNVNVGLARDQRNSDTLGSNFSSANADSSDNSSSAVGTVGLSSAFNSVITPRTQVDSGSSEIPATPLAENETTSASNNHSDDTLQTLSESIRTSITSCSDINPYLARYLQNKAAKKAPKLKGSNTKMFPSIRDRLKSTISLPSQSSDGTGASPKVVTSTGIPSVTILPATDTSQSVPVLSDQTIPQVSVVFSHSSRLGNLSESLPSSTVTSVSQSTVNTGNDIVNNNTGSVSINSFTSPDSTQTTSDTNLPVSSAGAQCRGLNVTVTPSTRDYTPVSLHTLFRRSALSTSSMTSTTIPSLLSPTSPFQTYQRGRVDRFRRDTSNRPHPYTRPSQGCPAPLSIMGPYLESRGVSVTNVSTSATSSNMIDSVIERALSRGGRNQSHMDAPTVSVVNRDSVQRTGQPIELVVDQNENYTAVRNANTVQDAPLVNEVHVSTNDDNNNSLHIVHQASAETPTTSNSNGENTRDQAFVELRNTFVSMTDQIEREMSDLNRRINALRDNLLSLRQDRGRYGSARQNMDTSSAVSEHSCVDNSAAVSRSQPTTIPVIITTSTEPQTTDTEQTETSEDTQGLMIQPPTLLETSLRSHRRGRHRQFLQRPYLESSAEPQDWRQLQRHYLHPHYSSSIFDETINRPSNAIQSAINRAIAGAFMGTGESAVANNIINQTHRIQCWDFTKCAIPDIQSSDKNIIVRHCKLHNSASCDLSKNGSLLATFVPSHQGFPDDNILAVFSLLPTNRGQCLYTKSFGPNAISISISPSEDYILVGLAAKKLSWVFTARQLVAQIYKLEEKEAGEKSTKLIKDIFHTCSNDIQTHVSGNSARWLPVVGQGLVYGTNRGHLQFCKPGVKIPVRKMDPDLTEEDQSDSVRRFILRRVPWLTHPDPHRVSASTQTQGARQTAATQTETEARETSH